MLEDIAILTGGKAIFEDLGIKLENVELKRPRPGQEGHASTRTTPRSSKAPATSKAIKGRIEQIKNEIDTTTSDYDREKLEERLAKLAGGVAQINVGAATEVEMKEKKARVEDALHACRAAVEEGILPGGGVAHPRGRRRPWTKVAKKRQRRREDRRGHRPPRPRWPRSSRSPRTPAWTARSSRQKVKETDDVNFGYNALTGEYGDMVKMGVIVPTKVERIGPAERRLASPACC